ncbi:hypothetical protein HMPREF9706_00323 [Facklamia hominis CCUG 36813]|uniref:Integrase catalytic domain-containing protein n=2 Tax=Facklamia hominis TaxID=178214 RepID=K1LI40_9LACT|nr:hypothetical protein HMPREF9706_00323 [Facklamia hominis CCUG 36813]EPH11856.1 hypothetical protein HMPREF9260_00806 [Facklamia hominis ACS-120-V-Sch10]
MAIRNLQEQTNYKLSRILEIVQFPKATYYYQLPRLDLPDKDESLKKEIRQIRKTHKDYGYRRIHGELRRRGYKINKKKVQRLIQEMNLQVISFSRRSRKYQSYKGDIGKKAPNRLNRRFMSSIPHQKIVTDTSEFCYYEQDESGLLRQKKLYLDPFIDLFNLEVVSYKVSKHPNKQSMMKAFEAAIHATEHCPVRRTFHSDQGWAYQMNDYQQLLKDHRIFQSMSRKGNCLDNAPAENFFGIMKQEMYYGKVYHSYQELEQAIHDYIRYYNEDRIKAKLGYLSPVEYKEQQMALSA